MPEKEPKLSQRLMSLPEGVLRTGSKESDTPPRLFATTPGASRLPLLNEEGTKGWCLMKIWPANETLSVPRK